MLRILTATALAVTLAGPTFAETTAVTCSTAEASKFKTQDDLIALLKTQGLTVVKIKTENGCYEAYTTDAAGKKATLGFNAETLEPVDNAEAGEG